MQTEIDREQDPYCYPMGTSAATAKLRRPAGAALSTPPSLTFSSFLKDDDGGSGGGVWPPIGNRATTVDLERERDTTASVTDLLLAATENEMWETPSPYQRLAYAHATPNI